MQRILAPVRCQILNNLVGDVIMEENSSCALPSAFSTVLCEFPQKKDFLFTRNMEQQKELWKEWKTEQNILVYENLGWQV